MLTAVPGEPREQVPLEVLRDVLGRLDFGEFEDVQFGLICLVLLFTFSRAECPCPKNFTGPQSWDPAKHWMWKDFKLAKTGRAWVLWVRFKGFKQDPRIQRSWFAISIAGTASLSQCSGLIQTQGSPHGIEMDDSRAS